KSASGQPRSRIGKRQIWKHWSLEANLRFSLREFEASRMLADLKAIQFLNVMGKSLFEKVWDAHAVRTLSNGQTQLLIGTHLIDEVTSPQAFGMLRDFGLPVAYPHRTFATVDHIVPT